MKFARHSIRISSRLLKQFVPKPIRLTKNWHLSEKFRFFGQSSPHKKQLQTRCTEGLPPVHLLAGSLNGLLGSLLDNYSTWCYLS